MIIIERVDASVVQAHEAIVDANVRLDRYDLEKLCPLSEIQCYRTLLEASDIGRLFLLGLTEFAILTQGHTCFLNGLLPGAAAHKRVAPFINDKVNLRTRPELAIFVISADQNGPLIVYDGNHRVMAQWLAYRTVEQIPAFVSIHSGINTWQFMPRLAIR